MARSMAELKRRWDLMSRRAELLMETIDLAARGWPEDCKRIDELDIEIEAITRELEGC